MTESDLVVGFQRAADDDPSAPLVADLLADLQSATERGVVAVEDIHDHAADDAATLDPEADADRYVEVVERVEDVGYLVERVHDQVALVSDLVAAHGDVDDADLAQRVVDFVDDADGMLLPSERAERYRNAVIDNDSP